MLKRKSLSCGFSFLFCLLFSFLLHKRKEKSKRKIPHAGKAVNKTTPLLGRESKENLKSVTFERKISSGNRVKP